MPYERVIYRRTEIYEKVWERPATEVAKDYGVSSVALAKICKRLGVPLPGRGYWARIAAGQKLPRVRLGPLAPGNEEQIVSSRWRPNRVENEVRPEVEEMLDHEHVQDARIVVSETLDAPHELVVHAQKVLSKLGRKKSAGMVCAEAGPCLDICVTPPLLERALRVMDAMLKALEARGFLVDVTSPSVASGGSAGATPSVTRALVFGEYVELALREGADNVVPRPPPVKMGTTHEEIMAYISRPRYVPEYRPNRKLTLAVANAGHLGLHHSWSDGKQLIEERLNTVMRGLVRIADAKRQAKLAAQRAAREQALRERLAAIDGAAKLLEKRRREDLGKRTEAWQAARELRELVETFRERAETVEGVCVDGNMRGWLTWADARVRYLEAEAFRPVALSAAWSTHPQTVREVTRILIGPIGR